MKLSILSFFIFLSIFSIAQENETPKPTNKGKVYAFWGWNRGWYSNSDITFTGENYDFTLTDVVANDRQSPFQLDPYFHPQRITIPQTNYRIGYFINDKIDISIGVDHMKYIMPENQTVKITGEINDNSNSDGSYNNDVIVLKSNFLSFEHSDGLNYINAEITRNDNLLEFFKINSNTNKFQINTLIGFGIGAQLPKSNVQLWNNERNDTFHLAGYGISAKVGLDITFFKHSFIRGVIKGGFMDMPDILTSPDPSDKASQHFLFSEAVFCFGYAFNPFY